MTNTCRKSWSAECIGCKSHDLLADTTEFWVPTAIFNKELADGVDKSVDENQSVLERTNPEPIDSKGSSSSSPLSPLSPHKKQTSSNAPEKNHKHSSEF